MNDSSAGPSAVLFASFALPLVAFGAAALAAGVPVLIHLLSRQRYQVVQWAAVRFLVTAQKRSKRRIDRWLLLAARMLALLLPLAGMCAATNWAENVWQSIKPGPPEAISNAPRTHRILVVDGSLSMTARAGEKTRFKTALDQAEQAIRAANPGDGFTLIYLAGSPQTVVPGPSGDAEKVSSELLALKATHGSADWTAALAMVADTLSKSPRAYPRKQVLLFTDLQRSAWTGLLPKPDGSAPDVWQRVLPKAEVAIVDAAAGDVDNVAVTDLALAEPLPLVDAPTAVTATVQNFGRTEKRGVRLELLVGRPSASGPESTLFPIEQRPIESIAPGERAAVTFSLEGASRFREAGLHLIQVKLLEGDELPADDTRTLAVEVREGLTALLVNGRPSAEPLRRGSEYLQEALAPGGRPIPGNPARPRTVSLTEFADPTLGDLSNVDCVFLCDVPTLTTSEIARLEAHLKRGGGVVFGLGPTTNLDFYNRVLSQKGQGLFPAELLEVKATVGAEGLGFRLAGDEETYRKPPLAAFRDDNARAGLTTVPFRKYVRMNAPTDGPARRVLSFVPADEVAKLPEANAAKPDAAVVEWPRHRGRVVVYASSFNNDWTDWPVLPSYLPFAHELLRFAASNPDRHTVRIGDPIEEFVPVNAVGLIANVNGPEGIAATFPVIAGDDTGLVRFSDATLAGIYRVTVPGKRERVFAANPPESLPGGGSESDLRRLDPADLRPLGPIAVVTEPTDAKLAGGEGGLVTLVPRPHGPTIARWLVTLGLLVIVLELWLAWILGPSRSSIRTTKKTAGEEKRPSSAAGLLSAACGFALIATVGLILLIVAHSQATGRFLGFLSEDLRGQIGQAAGVPAAGPGEDTVMRLEPVPVYLKRLASDAWLRGGFAVLAASLVLAVYILERRTVNRFSRVIIPLFLRLAVVFYLLFAVLPQLRLAFDREGWPDIAIILDTSASMSTVDELQDPAVKAKAEELKKIEGLTEADRLRLAQALVARPDGDLITRLVADRQVKVHIYSLSEQAQLVAEVDEAGDVAKAKEEIRKLKADGPSSRLGDGVQAVVKSFRGGSLAGVIVLTDGVTTAGDDLTKAGREAARAGVPLYLIGVGDAREPPDLILSDLKGEDVVLKNDELVFEARVTARGPNPASSVPVVLYERVGEKLVEKARTTVAPDPAGKPVPVRLTTIPSEVGEKTYVIDLPVQPGEAESGNNRIERVVLVTETKRLRVLYIEGSPRYEFRFVKVLLERETDAILGNKSLELSTLLLDASPGYADQDKSALKSMPTKSELFEYDVVILGDIDPAMVPKAQQTFQDLAEFVKVKGGGLLLLAGEQGTPEKLFATPLAELLPVVPSDAGARDPVSPEGYHPKLTPFGQTHPLFRFAAEEGENARAWGELKPLLWSAHGYKRKLSAEVLAVHPDRTADGFPGENHPLVLQQFVGSGRVIFFGLDETWRWRFRTGERRFDQFWIQAVRVLSRNRLARIELRTDKQTAYRRDEPIRLTVRFPDDAPAPAADSPIKVSVERGPLKGPDGAFVAGGTDAQVVQLAKVDGTRATYQTLLTRTPEGEYRFHLADPNIPGTKPRTEAKVLPPPGERERLEMNRTDLHRAASESRGKFYTLADADKVIDDLPDAARVPLNQPVPPIPLWNHAISFALILGLLACEWLMRRRERLL